MKKTTEKKTKVYRIDLTEIPYYSKLKDEEVPNISDRRFINEAEKQGNVYSLQGFAKAFNNEETNEANSFIRII